jgi:GR25 family glycosyltransferase involved in LPS biosynthesis
MPICTIQDIISCLHQFTITLITNKVILPSLDTEAWCNTLKVIDKFPIGLRIKNIGKITTIINELRKHNYSLDVWRIAYKCIHTIGDWFTLGHTVVPLYKYNATLVEELTSHFKQIQEISSTERKEKYPVICTMTSCKRLDLLTRTIDSMMVNCLDIKQTIGQWVVIDDNSSEEDRKKMQELYPFITFIFKTPEQKGHPISMNILREYILQSGEPYHLHIEDDWEWWYPEHYITKCVNVCKSDSKYGQTLINFEYTEDQHSALQIWNRDMRILNDKQQDSIRYFIHEYYNTQERINAELNILGATCSMYWPHFSFRVGITKTEVYQTIGPFSTTHKHFEMDYAQRYTKQGYLTTSLDCCYTTHIGRRTYERDSTKLNAYDLNQEQQFGEKPKDQSSSSQPSNQQTQPQSQSQSQLQSQLQSQHNTVQASNLTGVQMYVINLERRPERLLKFFKQNNQDCPSYQVFNAIDGKQLKPNGKIQRIFETGDYNFRRGIVGCAYSHLQIWAKFLKSSSQYCIVVEDDVRVCRGFNEKICALLSTYGSVMDLIFLHWNPYPNIQARCKNGGETFHPKEWEMTTPTPIVEEWSVDKSVRWNMGSGAGYILTRKGAKHMISFVNQYGMPNAVDWVLMKQPQLTIGYTKPKMVFVDCWQNNQQIQSDIQLEYDTVQYKTSNEWLMDEIKDWIGVCKTKSINVKEPIATIDWKKEMSELMFDKWSPIVLSSSYPKEWQNCKGKIFIIPYSDQDIDSGFPIKWYRIGCLNQAQYKIIVPDQFISSKVYQSKVWETNRLNLSSV